MSHDVAWPPRSPHAALLSSPSGRKKYQDNESFRSPMKRSATTPSLVDRLRAVRKGHDLPMQEDDMQEDLEEDEETLQLKLAAIEAKLKLKRLQQNKARAGTTGDSSRPSSSHGHGSTTSRTASAGPEAIPQPARVEVQKSPTRRPQISQPKSPSRLLLGIDKGVRAADVSLRRANTTGGSSRRIQEPSSHTNRQTSRSSVFSSARSAVSTENRKTFSERMTEAREREQSHEQRRNRHRSKGFGTDESEIEKYRLLAQDSIPALSRSPTRLNPQQAFTRDEIVQRKEEPQAGKGYLEKIRTMPEPQPYPPLQDNSDLTLAQGDASLFEGFSGLHLSSRILPHSFLKRTLPTDRFTIYRVPDLLKNITSPSFDLPDDVVDYVIFGVIASKSSPMDQKKPPPDSKTTGTNDWERQWEDGSQNQRRFMVFTLTDLKWTVDVYLFGTALPRYHRLTPGTLVAILNPGIMPPKPGKTDTGAFSLNLNNGDDTILEIGQARDLGYCKTLKKDGRECGAWLDASKTGICEWHLNAQLDKTRAKRMGVNTGTNGFSGTKRRGIFDKTGNGNGHGKGEGNGLLAADGHRYDRYTGNHFYIAKSNGGGGAAAASGARHGGLYDGAPSLAEGNLSRDRGERVRKHLAAQVKEREIAEKLGSGGHGQGFGFGSAGAEYLKLHARAKDSKGHAKDGTGGKADGQQANTDAESTLGSQRSASILAGPPSSALVNGRGNGNGLKRTAADVRLSPVKKTRFVTEKGIREAGRESLGVPTAKHADESEDDLEIV
ncbi:hypothetical protein LTR47_004687 [Exophiala xenobiotica]|nr:hypothetical protein LTR47_004687 [Exophiala xenobiotica]